MFRLGRTGLAAAVIAAAIPFTAPVSAWAQDAYVIGVTAAMTGPGAATQAPVMEVLQVYVNRLNAAGGINGHPIKLIIADDQAAPSTAAANVTKLIEQEKIILLINSSLSSTYAPMLAATQPAKIPVYYAGSVCPKDAYPPADPLAFCSTNFGTGYDSRFALSFVQKQGHGKNLAVVAMAIPVSRAEIEYAQSIAPNYGLKPVDMEVIPPPTPDYTPFATKLKDAKTDWYFSFAPWVTEVKTFEALRRLDWKGRAIVNSHVMSEAELARVKDPNLYVFGANAFFQDNLPVMKEIHAALEKDKINYPDSYSAEGWIAGMVLEATLKAAGWPATPDKIAAAMANLNVDTKGLRGGPLVWTKDNHYRTVQYYRVYHWDAAKNAVVRVMDWQPYPVK